MTASYDGAIERMRKIGIKHITANDLRRMHDSEGLIFQGCGGDLREWLDGINGVLTEEGILRNGSKFMECSVFEHNGTTNLLFPFKDVKLDIGRLAMWRLRTHDTFGGTWLSDYVPNYLGGFISVPMQENGMDIKIFQINSDRDAEHIKFMGMTYLAEKGHECIDPGIYDEVFSGNVDCKSLEDVFAKFNTDSHPLHRGHSLSVSDVVLTAGGAYFCDTVGFKEIEFDESQCQKPNNLLKIVYIEPNRAPFISEVGSDLKSLQKAVQGRIEPIYLGDGAILVGNDESKLLGMEGNRRIGNSVIAGPFFIVGADGEDFCSLTDDEAQRYMERFAEPEQISQQEVQDDMGFTITTF